ncbi:GGDEF domain-containing protein [Pontitalea aquivivens]|uniref:GGDEF domain-containing protein n=1 Tax=Pontitalea aquivivens TaxID=3388663 RepID=UPI0039708B2E
MIAAGPDGAGRGAPGGDDGDQGAAVPLGPEVLGRLMPMFLWLCRDGRIRGAGPTLRKIVGAGPLTGDPFDAHFRVGRAPAAPGLATEGLVRRGRLHLSLRADPAAVLRGQAVALGPAGGHGVLLNLTFGIGLAEAVRDFGLTEADFAPSDLAMELLYLREAKDAVLAELKALNQRLEAARRLAEAEALTDPLTGLANRRALEAALAQEVAALARGGGAFAVAHLDLDHFKAVNDTFGHAAGDHVLTRVAAVLRAETRRGDVVARVGGDEFVLLLRANPDPARLTALGTRIIARLEEPCLFQGASCRISGSIGIVLSASYRAPDPDRMLADADAALYGSKRGGRGRCTVVMPPGQDGVAVPDDAGA